MASHSPSSIQTPALAGLPETRRELLDYLKRTASDRYKVVLEKLSLRK